MSTIRGLIETHGEYSMPEGPNERRLRYEGASDPIKRFLYECVEEGSKSDVIGKTDAYTVYSEMCNTHDERMAGEDTFKQEVTKQTIIDVEKFRTRKITPGEDKDPAWRFATFSDDAKMYMPQRLQERYFGEGDVTGDSADADDEAGAAERSDERGVANDAVFNATPIATAAESLTGYTTVTAEIAAAMDMPGDGNNGVKAIAKDVSGAIDIVAWDDPFASRLQEIEGEHVAIEYAEVGEYEDSRQLMPTEGLTEIVTIQPGVGHTEGAATADSQAGLDETVADGGASNVPDDAIGSKANAQRLYELLEDRATTAPIAKGELIQKATDRYDMNPGQAADALETAVEEKGLITADDDGYRPV